MNLFQGKKKEITILIFLFLLTIFLRGYRIQETFNFNAEYNYKLWAIKEVAFDHKIRLIGIEAVSYLHHLHYPPLMLYIFSPLLIISKANPLSIEIFLILVNGMNSILVYFFLKNLLGKKGAFLGGIVYATSLFIQRADRFIWVVGPIITVSLSYFLVIRALQRQQKYIYFLLLGTVLGIGVNFHFQAAIFLIPSLVVLYFSKKALFIKLIIFLSGFLPFILPLIIFELRHNFYNFQGALILLKDTSGIASGFYFQLLIESATDIGRIMVKTIYDNWSANKSLSILSFMPIIYVAVLLIRSKKLELLSAGILIVISFLLYPQLQNRFYSVLYYLYFLIPIFILFIAWFFEKLLSTNKYVFYIVFLIFLTSNLFLNLTFRQLAPIKDQKMAVDWIVKDAGAKPIIIKFPNYPSDEYSFLFYHSSKKNNLSSYNISFSEPWNETGKIDYIMSSTEKMSGSKEFGLISITKIK